MKKFTFLILFTAFFAQATFSQIINFGHTQHSGRSAASFSVLRADFDDFTDYFYWNDVELTKDIYPTVYAGVDENYWNAGACVKNGNLKASLIFYEQIANYKDWPSNMTDLGLAFNIGIGEKLTFQGRYYDFCYSGGKGTAMPGATIAYLFGDEEFKHRIGASLDWSIWSYKPRDTGMLFARPFIKYDYSKDSENGFGIQYKAMAPAKKEETEIDVSNITSSHTISLWAGITKDIEDFTVGIRPNGYYTFNASNPTNLPVNYKGEIEDYNPFPESGNKEFHILLPVALTYHLNEKVEIIASVFFGLYHANFDHANFLDSKGNKRKYTGTGGSNNRGWVNEKGVGLGLNFTISPRCNFQIGTNFIRIPELTGDESGDAFDNHLYTAENLSAANLAKAPLSVSGKFSF